MRSLRFSVILPLVGLLTVPALAQGTEKGKPVEASAKLPSALVLGQRLAQPVSLTNLEGERLPKTDFAGKITVLNFWSTGCPIQKAWNPALTEIIGAYSEKGVRFAMINSNVKNGEIDPGNGDGELLYPKIRAHLETEKLPFNEQGRCEVLVDPDNMVADIFRARTTPHVFVLDAKGTLVYQGLVDDDMRGKPKNTYLRDVLDELLAGKDVKPFSTPPRGCSIKRAHKRTLPAADAKAGGSAAGSDK